MLYFTTAAVAARRIRRDDNVVVKMPGPPLWRLVLEEVADAFTERWRRMADLLRRKASTGRGDRQAQSDLA